MKIGVIQGKFINQSGSVDFQKKRGYSRGIVRNKIVGHDPSPAINRASFRGDKF